MEEHGDARGAAREMVDPVTTDWEALLEAEGLGPITLSRLATPRELELCTEGYTGTDSSAYDEVRALEEAMTWLPAQEQLVLDLHRRGWTQAQVAEHCGVSRGSLRKTMARAVRRTRALNGGPLPDDLHHLGQLLQPWWSAAGLTHQWPVVKNTLLLVVGLWSIRHAADRHQVASSTVHDWLVMVERDGDERAAHVFDVIRRMPA